VENAGAGPVRSGLTPGPFEFPSQADREEPARPSIRERLALLAGTVGTAGEPEPAPAAPAAEAVDQAATIRSAVEDAIRDLLPGVLQQTLQETVRAAVDQALAQQRTGVVDVIDEYVTELRASAVSSAAMPDGAVAPGPDPVSIELAAIRADTARALDTIYQHLAEYIAERFSEVRAELRSDMSAEVTSGYAIVVDRLRRGLTGQVGEALLSIQSEFAGMTQAHRASVGALSEEVRELVAEHIEGLRRASGEIDFLGDNLRSTLTAYADEQLAVLEASADRSSTGVVDLSRDVQAQLSDLVARIGRDLQEVAVAGRESLGSIGPSVRGDVAAATTAIRTDVEMLTGGVRDDLDQHAARIRRDLDTLASTVKTDIDGLLTRTKAELARLVTEVRSSLAVDFQSATAAARDAAVASVEAAVERRLGDLRAPVEAAEDQLAATRSEVALFSDRFAKVGHAFLDHLAARDLLLEHARDELLDSLLRDLTAGMSERDRSAAKNRLTELVQRRRDARDAERWRTGVPAVPKFPAGVQDESDLAALLDTPPRQPEVTGQPPAARSALEADDAAREAARRSAGDPSDGAGHGGDPTAVTSAPIVPPPPPQS